MGFWGREGAEAVCVCTSANAFWNRERERNTIIALRGVKRDHEVGNVIISQFCENRFGIQELSRTGRTSILAA